MLNNNLRKIEKENTFSLVTKKVNEYKALFPDKELVSLGIGDVSKPLIKPCIEAMHKAVDDLSTMDSFSGYGNYYGLPSLRKLILENEYQRFGFTVDEIYVSDGTKSDSSNILELFSKDVKLYLADPLYPIYKNGAIALNRKFYFGQLDDDYKLIVPEEKYDIVYLCSPNNPIGNVYSYDDLKKWVDYCHKFHSIIIFDNVYEVFIRNKNLPHSIYEIEGAKDCAIELRSFSKKASFTGVRCSYFVIPNNIETGINYYWKERTLNRFNGACYIAQKGAEATFSKEAKKLIKANIDDYLKNARYLKTNFEKLGFKVVGGEDAPFMWVKIKEDISSWEVFDLFLNELNIIVIPGIIFGKNGDGYFRVSALGTLDNSKIAIKRLKKYYEE